MVCGVARDRMLCKLFVVVLCVQLTLQSCNFGFLPHGKRVEPGEAGGIVFIKMRDIMACASSCLTSWNCSVVYFHVRKLTCGCDNHEHEHGHLNTDLHTDYIITTLSMWPSRLAAKAFKESSNVVATSTAITAHHVSKEHPLQISLQELKTTLTPISHLPNIKNIGTSPLTGSSLLTFNTALTAMMPPTATRRDVALKSSFSVSRKVKSEGTREDVMKIKQLLAERRKSSGKKNQNKQRGKNTQHTEVKGHKGTDVKGKPKEAKKPQEDHGSIRDRCARAGKGRFSYHPQSDQCFFKSHQPMTWYKALKACKTFQGGMLAVLETNRRYDGLMDWLRINGHNRGIWRMGKGGGGGTGGFWYGVIADEGVWKWVTREKCTWKWNDFARKGTCQHMLDGPFHKTLSASCREPKAFVCQIR